MKQSPSWEVNSSLAKQEITQMLWKVNVHYHIHKRPSESEKIVFSDVTDCEMWGSCGSDYEYYWLACDAM